MRFQYLSLELSPVLRTVTAKFCYVFFPQHWPRGQQWLHGKALCPLCRVSGKCPVSFVWCLLLFLPIWSVLCSQDKQKHSSQLRKVGTRVSGNSYQFSTWFFLKIKFRFFFLTSKSAMHACMCTTSLPGICRGQKRVLTTCNWNYRWLWASIWGVGTKPRSSARVTGALNC